MNQDESIIRIEGAVEKAKAQDAEETLEAFGPEFHLPMKEPRQVRRLDARKLADLLLGGEFRI